MQKDRNDEVLEAAGWCLGRDGFWSHPAVDGGALVTENIALYFEAITGELKSLRATLSGRRTEREENMEGRAYTAEKFYAELRAAVLRVCAACVHHPRGTAPEAVMCGGCLFRRARSRAIVPVIFPVPEGYIPAAVEDEARDAARRRAERRFTSLRDTVMGVCATCPHHPLGNLEGNVPWCMERCGFSPARREAGRREP